MRTRKSGFTLVEILIVVIILGILAAIVIPHFTNASEDARESSLRSTLQTLRSQLELYKLQHRDLFPLSTVPLDNTGNWSWDQMTTMTDETGAAGGTLGPYMQSPSINSLLQGNSGVQMVADDAAALGATAGAGEGFVFSRATGKIWAYNKDGGIFAE